MKRFSLGLLAAMLVLAGCGGGGSSSAPVPVTGATAPGATPTPVATATPTGGATPNFTAPPAISASAPPAPPFTAPPSASPTAVPPAPASAHKTIAHPNSTHRVAAAATAQPIVQFSTVLGNIRVQLRPDAAPQNVANFLSYVNGGAYNGSFIHRSVPSFVIQGGGYTDSTGTIEAIPTRAPVVNEYNLSNVRGTLAMAKIGSDPNSATSQWFFNTADNSSTLNSQDGGFTVIGQVTDTNGLAVMDAINALQTVNEGSPFDELPVINYSSGTPTASNLVTVNGIATVPAPGFFAGQQNIGNGVYYLQFPNGNYFGYYTYLSNPNYIYHYDLGYEYVFDANDGQNGVYLYDFKSGHFLYTSPNFPFPYIYDFTLNAVLYYYPDPNNAGRYNSNGTRYFYNFATGKVISQ
jgi:cyclophilin family peptidyl-prolyl cis-trans isomerase